MDEGVMPGKPVVQPIKYASLSEKAKKEALNAINLIQHKRDDSLKGRTCADGSKQKAHMKEGDSIYSPTVSV